MLNNKREKTLSVDDGGGAVPQTTEDTGETSSALGQFDARRFLMDAGLDNVFNFYQRNMNVLDVKEKQTLQDAYYIRELSRKYLGEYASTLGIGDVSGNLMDIFGKYQENVIATRTAYDAERIKLQDAYETARINIMATQGAEAEAEHSANIRQVIDNLGSGYYGYREDENGNRTRVTTPQDYIEYAAEKYNLTAEEKQSLLDIIQWGVDTQNENQIDITSVSLPIYNGQTNISFQPNYDPTYYFSSTEIDSKSLVFMIEGTEFVSVISRVDEDEGATMTVSSADLTEYFVSESQKAGSSFYGKTVTHGTVMYHPDTSAYYVFRSDSMGGSWHRLISGDGSRGMIETSRRDAKNWYIPDGQKEVAYNGAVFKTNENKADTFTINGITYVEDFKSSEAFEPDGSNLSGEQKQIVAEFMKYHSNVLSQIKRMSIVFINGRFWECNTHGKIVPMKKQ